MKMRVNNNWLGKVLFVFCLSIVSNYGFADIASVGYVDSVVGALDIPDPQVNSDWNATSGVAQILNKPTIPAAANNATLTIQRNGKLVGTFSADASVPVTMDIVDSDTTYTAGTGISVSGATIANTAISQVRSGSSTSATLVDIWLE